MGTLYQERNNKNTAKTRQIPKTKYEIFAEKKFLAETS